MQLIRLFDSPTAAATHTEAERIGALVNKWVSETESKHEKLASSIARRFVPRVTPAEYFKGFHESLSRDLGFCEILLKNGLCA